MSSTPLSLFLSLLLLLSAPLALAAPKDVTPSLALPLPLHLNPYTNPSTSSDCNLDCRRVFCNSVSQFLESVTCTQHRPCLSLNLQFKIQEKCLNWRPEIHHPAATALDPDCVGPQWVKAYVPADIGYEWLRRGSASRTRPQGEQTDEVCVGVLRWVCLVAVVVALFCAWKVKERRAPAERRVKGKEELA